eukprot:2682818-Amphidinium_carterae.1
MCHSLIIRSRNPSQPGYPAIFFSRRDKNFIEVARWSRSGVCYMVPNFEVANAVRRFPDVYAGVMTFMTP